MTQPEDEWLMDAVGALARLRQQLAAAEERDGDQILGRLEAGRLRGLALRRAAPPRDE